MTDTNSSKPRNTEHRVGPQVSAMTMLLICPAMNRIMCGDLCGIKMSSWLCLPVWGKYVGEAYSPKITRLQKWFLSLPYPILTSQVLSFGIKGRPSVMTGCSQTGHVWRRETWDTLVASLRFIPRSWRCLGFQHPELLLISSSLTTWFMPPLLVLIYNLHCNLHCIVCNLHSAPGSTCSLG